MKTAKKDKKRLPYVKYIAMLLFIALPFIGFYLGIRYQQAITPDAMPMTTQISLNSPDGIVQTYYNNYLTCQNNHFAHLTGNSPVQDCPYNKFGFLTTSLDAKLQQVRNADPVLCAQNVPLKITYEKAVMNGEHATIDVNTHWGSSPTQTIIVGLDREQNQWKIDAITCQVAK